MIMLNVFYRAKPGMREKFVGEVDSSGTLASIRGEKGCGGYEYFASLEDPDRLFLLEQWADEEALTVHQSSPGMAALRTIKEKYVADTEIRRY